MDAGTHLRAIWHRRWYVLAGTLLVAAGVFALRASATPMWTTTSTLFVVAGTSDRADPLRDLQRLAVTYGDFADEPEVLREAAERLPERTAAEVGAATGVETTG
jgi:uncharacterized protein involved in exopolysaccharide biosynthesis